MRNNDLATQLQEQGIALLRDIFPAASLNLLKHAAIECFEAVQAGTSIPERYGFNPFAHSVLLTALEDFGCGAEQLLAPLSTPGLEPMFSDATGRRWRCHMEQTWVRKKFPPLETRSAKYHPQGWHQDGALGVQFPLEPGPAIPMTELLTCWIPLNPCGKDSPGLEFVRGCQAELVHFTELSDSSLRRRFAPEQFWAPELEFGDGLVFLNSVLHRTYVVAEMRHPRLSVEYRLFPCS